MENPQPLLIKSEIQISAPASRVWASITEAEYTSQYMFGCAVASEFTVGSLITYTDATRIQVTGHVQGIEPGKMLQHTVFDPEMGLPDIPENYLFVRYELEDQGQATLLKVVQGDYAVVADGQKRYEDSLKGWPYILNAIKELLEK